ncbi:hypothetical protein KIH07_01275 [Hydrogenophaga taeniospiralis]|uniref:hypothetical protein n=1 Tax=Hydrogenophaga taeniospiralis TaxID=65656 RepID=UPI001CFBCB31|nr:hypothetical protein [Hydrogenophaga taeniospiralis]MCB4362345.1 hypothetical protein [Hydrogenophaga taeniospiralis]
MIEIFLRLGLALIVSLGLAVLLAWGWDSSERSAAGDETIQLSADTPLAPKR